MILRNHFISLVILTFSLNGFSQTIRSGKSSIHLNTIKKEVEITDNLPPSISIRYPILVEEEKLIVHEDELLIHGKVTDESGINALYINENPISLDDNNWFATKINLDEGDNNISIIAEDNLGNSCKTEYVVHYKPEIIFSAVGKGGNYYALLIGIDDYSDQNLDDLDNPIADATRLKEILINHYTFDTNNINLIENAKRKEIILALEEFKSKITPYDNFLLFYAGHGWLDEKANVGYWLPSDAAKTNKVDWYPNSDLRNYLKGIEAKHALVIADACFAGSIFQARGVTIDPQKSIPALYEHPSRKAMTSGNKTEVPDRSAFTEYLIETLAENQEKYIASEQLFNSFKIAVINNSDVEPLFGEIRNVGDQGGDFIFIRK